MLWCYVSDYKCTWNDSLQCMKCKMLQRLRISLQGCCPCNAKDVKEGADLPRLRGFKCKPVFCLPVGYASYSNSVLVRV